jgi:hypothetical protein
MSPGRRWDRLLVGEDDIGSARQCQCCSGG